MRILTFTKLYPNSQQPEHGIFVARRMEALQHYRSHEIQVVAPVPYYPAFIPAFGEWKKLQKIPAVETHNQIKIHHPRYFNPPKFGMAQYGQWMAQGSLNTLKKMQVEKFNFQVIDAHFVYPDGYAALRLGQALGLPVVVTARGSDVLRNRHLPQILPLLQTVIKGATRLIAVSDELKQNFIDLGASADKIAVIPNGVDTQVFFPQARDEACAALQLDPRTQWLISVARLDQNKGQWLILDALKKIGGAELAKKRIKIAFIGQGESRAELEKASQMAGLGDIVFFAGQQPPEKIRLWNNVAQAKILASSREGSPNVVLESLACGTPVIATNVGTNAELIKSGITGFLLPPENSEALQNVILLALQQNWDRNAIAQTVTARNWATVAAEVETSLQAAIQN